MMNRMFGLVAAPNAEGANGQEARRGAVVRLAARAAKERREMVDGVLFTTLPKYYIGIARRIHRGIHLRSRRRRNGEDAAPALHGRDANSRAK
jgi:hypothetical protein